MTVQIFGVVVRTATGKREPEVGAIGNTDEISLVDGRDRPMLWRALAPGSGVVIPVIDLLIPVVEASQ